MTDKEARELLGLPETGALDKAVVEAAYNRLFRDHQTRLNAALCFDERDRESQILMLLTEARKICLGVSTAKAQSTTQSASNGSGTTWSGVPQTNVRPQRRRSSCNGSVQHAAMKFGDVFVHLWLALKNLFGFLRAVPDAFVEAKDFVCEMLDQLQVAGIPKIIMVLVMILLFLPLINGCVQAIHKMSGWFK